MSDGVAVRYEIRSGDARIQVLEGADRYAVVVERRAESGWARERGPVDCVDLASAVQLADELKVSLRVRGG